MLRTHLYILLLTATVRKQTECYTSSIILHTRNPHQSACLGTSRGRETLPSNSTKKRQQTYAWYDDMYSPVLTVSPQPAAPVSFWLLSCVGTPPAPAMDDAYVPGGSPTRALLFTVCILVLQGRPDDRVAVNGTCSPLGARWRTVAVASTVGCAARGEEFEPPWIHDHLPNLQYGEEGDYSCRRQGWAQSDVCGSIIRYNPCWAGLTTSPPGPGLRKTLTWSSWTPMVLCLQKRFYCPCDTVFKHTPGHIFAEKKIK